MPIQVLMPALSPDHGEGQPCEVAEEGRRDDQVGRRHRRDRDRQGDDGSRGDRRGHARQDLDSRRAPPTSRSTRRSRPSWPTAKAPPISARRPPRHRRPASQKEVDGIPRAGRRGQADDLGAADPAATGAARPSPIRRSRPAPRWSRRPSARPCAMRWPRRCAATATCSSWARKSPNIRAPTR